MAAIVDVDTVVIGAGAVGLACAATLARSGAEVLVLEAAGAIGTLTSSRNSEVVHAGLYYPTGSLRHLHCVAGRRSLYAWMDTHGVAYRKTGKLIVAASDAQIPKIEALHAQGVGNDVEGLSLLTRAEAMALEPHLTCKAAVLSAETGVFDSHGYMLSLHGELEDHGGAIAFNTPVLASEILADGRFRVDAGGAAPMTLVARNVVNSAGLYAHAVARSMSGYHAGLLPPFTLAKGSYFSCQTRPAFSRLIYPAPVEGGLGVHVTLDLGGRMRFGPDVEWLHTDDPDAVDYRVDIRRADSFYAAVREYWPALPDGAIAADYSGCRPQLSFPGQPAADFRIDAPAHHGHAGLVHLFGIESPGLTSSLSIAEAVSGALKG
jgi:L-2-hydroxyglutarate oxidase LhgO